jgi:hypothetical protein
MKINNKFDFEEDVYLKNDPSQYKRLVIEININPGLFLMYKVSIGTETSWHHEMELSHDRDDALALNINN